MCLLSYFPPGVQPDLGQLAAGAAVNRDGYGFAIVEDTTLIIRKSMNSRLLLAEFAQLRQEHPNGPALFHSRMGTGGLRTVYNCHPFYMGEDKLTVVAHNGVLFGMKRGKECDTRAFAGTLLPQWFGKLDHYRLRLTLERWLGRTNKMVVLTANPAFANSAYLLNEESGHWDDGRDGTGAWHSNSDFHRGYYYRSDSAGLGALIGDSPRGVQCDICWRRGGVDPDTSHCVRCGHCNDCYEPVDLCFCFLPGGEHGRLAITAGAREEST